MGYITSKQLNQKEALTGPARQEQIDKARIKELEEQLALEKAKKDGNESRVAGKSASKNSGENPKTNKGNCRKRKSSKASSNKPLTYSY